MRGDLARILLITLLLITACASGRSTAPTGGAPTGGAPTGAPCNLWYAIGDTPTDAELDAAAGRYDVVILNAWETGALARLRAADPTITVLVYKDLSSTRSYSGADGSTADPLPTGVPYVEADTERPEWFAVDERGDRIEWDPYPGHWQMAVWEPAYRQRWTDSVVAETVAAGFDGVFADNDFARLRFYSSAVLAGMGDADAADELIRAGLDAFVTEAGTALRRQGKVLVPNISETRLFPGRWDEHTRYGGGMEENLAHFGPDAGSEYLTGAGWTTQTAQLGLPDRTSLAVTPAAPGDLRAQRYGFASAVVRGAGRTCWTVDTLGGYTAPEWTPMQDVPLGEPVGPGEQDGSGVWSREFRGGWVAVNPTDAPARVTPPEGIGSGPVVIPAADSVVRGRP